MTRTYTATLHMNRASQVVRIPKALAFEGVEKVEIFKVGRSLMLQPVENPSREAWIRRLEQMEPWPEDFELERPELGDPEGALKLMMHGEDEGE
ncbi:MAG: AbrB/MazE/SpoVT family DNA-binding domain-containing protein [Rhodocyclaceae bacterium]|nr:AbrB/MazE/SpoVT family DNA-binding domain-containing protein [Rhodocyclaceae bacterium]MBR4737508.1 AbrB/MazE/SpoVT family DNA-binding domain-containing protein [Rhodocyclaceae bacterium]